MSWVRRGAWVLRIALNQTGNAFNAQAGSTARVTGVLEPRTKPAIATITHSRKARPEKTNSLPSVAQTKPKVKRCKVFRSLGNDKQQLKVKRRKVFRSLGNQKNKPKAKRRKFLRRRGAMFSEIILGTY